METRKRRAGLPSASARKLALGGLLVGMLFAWLLQDLGTWIRPGRADAAPAAARTPAKAATVAPTSAAAPGTARTAATAMSKGSGKSMNGSTGSSAAAATPAAAATSPKTAKPTAAKVDPAPAKASAAAKADEATGVERRTTYAYDALGRRDPFVSMAEGFVGNDVGGDAPVDVGGIKVVGIVWGSDAFALVEDPRGNSRILRRGDHVMNGTVEELKRDAVVVGLTADGQTHHVSIPLIRKGESHGNQ